MKLKEFFKKTGTRIVEVETEYNRKLGDNNYGSVGGMLRVRAEVSQGQDPDERKYRSVQPPAPRALRGAERPRRGRRRRRHQRPSGQGAARSIGREQRLTAAGPRP